MSSPTPAALVSAMSMMTTSASSLSAIARATVAPTLPAPPTTVTFRFIGPLSLHVPPKGGSYKCETRRKLHVRNDCVADLGALHLGRSVHQPREIVGDGLRRDGAVHALDHQVRGFGPSHVPQHHFSRQHDGAGIDLVEIRVLRRGAVRGFEDRVPRQVVDVAAGRDA